MWWSSIWMPSSMVWDAYDSIFCFLYIYIYNLKYVAKRIAGANRGGRGTTSLCFFLSDCEALFTSKWHIFPRCTTNLGDDTVGAPGCLLHILGHYVRIFACSNCSLRTLLNFQRPSSPDLLFWQIEKRSQHHAAKAPLVLVWSARFQRHTLHWFRRQFRAFLSRHLQQNKPVGASHCTMVCRSVAVWSYSAFDPVHATHFAVFFTP